MKTYRVCGRPDGSCCPEVIVHDNKSVDVMDKDQTVKFTQDQWDILRMKIKKGEL